MKKKSLFTALALSTALVTGTAFPAFAVVDSDEDQDSTEPSISNMTNVKVLSIHDPAPDVDAQVSVTIPLNMTVVADTDGGALQCPDNYYIANNSARSKVKVTGKCEVTGNGLKLKLTSNETEASPEGVVADGLDGNMLLKLTPTVGETALTEWTVPDEHTGWEIDVAKKADVKVEGSTSKIARVLDVEATAPNSLVFMYTVEKVDDGE